MPSLKKSTTERSLLVALSFALLWIPLSAQTETSQTQTPAYTRIDVIVFPGGFDPAAAVDVEGIRTVLELRSRYARPERILSDPARYYDLSYYDQASNLR